MTHTDSTTTKLQLVPWPGPEEPDDPSPWGDMVLWLVERFKWDAETAFRTVITVKALHETAHRRAT